MHSDIKTFDIFSLSRVESRLRSEIERKTGDRSRISETAKEYQIQKEDGQSHRRFRRRRGL